MIVKYPNTFIYLLSFGVNFLRSKNFLQNNTVVVLVRGVVKAKLTIFHIGKSGHKNLYANPFSFNM